MPHEVPAMPALTQFLVASKQSFSDGRSHANFGAKKMSHIRVLGMSVIECQLRYARFLPIGDKERLSAPLNAAERLSQPLPAHNALCGSMTAGGAVNPR
jgi:hypothetical protein